ncbi:MAG: RidA family protein [Rhodobacteraceae bacterium]|nr:RidA family protein [Paracoccaceae bacterium]
MTILRHRGGGAFEDRVGYCRAVVAGGFVHVSGTVAPGPDVPADVVAQCRAALATIEQALIRAGSSFEKAVRVTYILPDRADFEACWPVLRETFGANPPAATMFEAGLIDPKYRIEIELTALA